MTITIKLVEPTDYTVLRSIPNKVSIDKIKKIVDDEWGEGNWVSIQLPNNKIMTPNDFKEIRNA